MSIFSKYVGIDYSGLKAPVSRLKQLQVFDCLAGSEPARVEPYDAAARNWCRKEVGKYIRDLLLSEDEVIIGIDHSFSFPESYFLDHTLPDWDTFLDFFTNSWPAHHDHMYIDFLQKKPNNLGDSRDLRLCEKWTSDVKNIFHPDTPDLVTKSTLAGLPWLRELRCDPNLSGRVHFWPFDGFVIERHKSAIVEVHSSFFRRRYNLEGRESHEHDAYSITRWLQEMDWRGVLPGYFNPPLTLPERRIANLEGWILGVR
jgi:hypothetical protein